MDETNTPAGDDARVPAANAETEPAPDQSFDDDPASDAMAPLPPPDVGWQALVLPDEFWAAEESDDVESAPAPGRAAATDPDGRGRAPAAASDPLDPTSLALANDLWLEAESSVDAPIAREQAAAYGPLPSRRRRAVGLAVLASSAAAVVIALALAGGGGDGSRRLDVAQSRATTTTSRPSTTVVTAVPVTGSAAALATASAVVPGSGAASAGGSPTPSDPAPAAAAAAAAAAPAADTNPGRNRTVVTDPPESEPADPEPAEPSPVYVQPVDMAPPVAAVLTRLPNVELEVLALTNADRAANGVQPLQRDGCMDAEASAWAQSMAEANVMAHSAGGGDAVQGCRGSGAYWGDNIGYWLPCYAAEMEAWWMNSPSHRPHILDPTFTAAGIGVWEQPNGTCWFQVYFGS